MFVFRKAENTKVGKIVSQWKQQQNCYAAYPYIGDRILQGATFPYGPDRLRVGKYHYSTDFVALYQW